MAKKVDASVVFGRAKDLMSDLKDLINRRDTLQAQCDAKIKPIQNDFDKKMVPISEQISVKEKALEQLASEHRDILFTDEKKSLETPFGAFGFKKTPAALTFIENEGVIIAAIRKAAKKFADLWIVSKETVSKTSVKKSIEAGDFNIDKLADLGMEMVEGEKFSYKIGSQKL